MFKLNIMWVFIHLLFQFLVFFQGFLVNVYLPTDAAAMLTPIGNASKTLVICRGVKLHDTYLSAGNFIKLLYHNF